MRAPHAVRGRPVVSRGCFAPLSGRPAARSGGHDAARSGGPAAGMRRRPAELLCGGKRMLARLGSGAHRAGGRERAASELRRRTTSLRSAAFAPPGSFQLSLSICLHRILLEDGNVGPLLPALFTVSRSRSVRLDVLAVREGRGLVLVPPAAPPCLQSRTRCCSCHDDLVAVKLLAGARPSVREGGRRFLLVLPAAVCGLLPCSWQLVQLARVVLGVAWYPPRRRLRPPVDGLKLRCIPRPDRRDVSDFTSQRHVDGRERMGVDVLSLVVQLLVEEHVHAIVHPLGPVVGVHP
mmetsp:Transcript_20259/g.67598  ORF Transcript_20259/g.67598 Transcript_20259/m.67598 type:complete len:293 (-) Transcript_20259:35-913(-)